MIFEMDSTAGRQRGSEVARIASLFAATPAPTCVVDASSLRVLEINPAGCQRLGRQREQLLGIPLDSLLTGRPGIVLPGGEEPFVLELEGPEGAVRLSGQRIEWAGKPAAVVTVSQEHGGGEERAAAGIVSSAQEAILQLDDDLVILAANPAARAMFGASESALVGRNFQRFLPAAYREEYGAVLLGLGIAGQLRRAPVTELLLLRAGGEGFVGAAGIARLDSGRGIAVVIRDVTAARAEESALRDLQRRFEVLNAVTPAGIVRADAEGVCIYLNQEACSVIGRSREEALGRRWVSFIHHEDASRHAVTWAQARSNEVPFEGAYRVVRPDGEVRWIDARARAELDPDGDVRSYIGAFVDITDRR